MKILTKFLMTMLALTLAACTSVNFGSQINQELRVGMTNDEVSLALDRLEASGSKFIQRGTGTVGAQCLQQTNLCNGNPDFELLLLYREDQHPYGVLKMVNNGTPYRYVDYWSGSSNSRRLVLFFDERTKLLRGWTNDMNYLGWKYQHERICSKMKLEYDVLLPARKTEVHQLIGPPTAVIDAPSAVSREILEDHYWHTALFPPTKKDTPRWEVYDYALPSGSTRHVYLAYTRADRLDACGYDHAAEEAERFLSEQRALVH